jgi:hypothetical protein
LQEIDTLRKNDILECISWPRKGGHLYFSIGLPESCSEISKLVNICRNVETGDTSSGEEGNNYNKTQW